MRQRTSSIHSYAFLWPGLLIGEKQTHGRLLVYWQESWEVQLVFKFNCVVSETALEGDFSYNRVFWTLYLI